LLIFISIFIFFFSLYCKVHNWLVSWWCSLVPWSFCFSICANGSSRKTWTNCMCSGCKFYCRLFNLQLL